MERTPNRIILCLAVVLVFLTAPLATPSHGWLIYHKPQFLGKVVDAQTKEPIAGALVFVIYKKRPIIGGPGGSWSTTINIREELTDQNGEFKVPAYTTLIHPLSKDENVDFDVYMVGYKIHPQFTIRAYKKGLAFYPLSQAVLERIDLKWKQEFEKFLTTIPANEQARQSRKSIEDINAVALLSVPHAKERLQNLDIPYFVVPDDIALNTISFGEDRPLFKKFKDERSLYQVFGLAKVKSRREILDNIPSPLRDLEADLSKKQNHLMRIINEQESLGKSNVFSE